MSHLIPPAGARNTLAIIPKRVQESSPLGRGVDGPDTHFDPGGRAYDDLVRVKISITLPAEMLGQLDRLGENRSAFLERAALAYLAQLERQARDRRDIEIINRHAARLNREAFDTLEYQDGRR